MPFKVPDFSSLSYFSSASNEAANLVFKAFEDNEIIIHTFMSGQTGFIQKILNEVINKGKQAVKNVVKTADV